MKQSGEEIYLYFVNHHIYKVADHCYNIFIKSKQYLFFL